MSHCYFTRPLRFWKRIVDSVKNIYEAFLDGTLKSVLQSIFFQKRLFLFYTPVHTNMGDQAIRSGEMRFLNTFFPQYKIIELTEKIWREDTEKIFKKLIKNTDLLMIHGGGYLGDLWLNGENSFKPFLPLPILTARMVENPLRKHIRPANIGVRLQFFGKRLRLLHQSMSWII